MYGLKSDWFEEASPRYYSVGDYEGGTALISLHIDIFHFNSLQMSLYEREFRSKMVLETCMRRNWSL